MAKSKADELIDRSIRPKCNSGFHKLPEDGQQVLRRARERFQEGETFGWTRLADVLTQEFDVRITDKTVKNYVRNGCQCEDAA